jgi:hypothetical protein
MIGAIAVSYEYGNEISVYTKWERGVNFFF